MKRKTITVINYYSLFPINHGGKHAIRGLYQALSSWCNIRIITFCPLINGDDYYRDCVSLNPYIDVYQIVRTESIINEEMQYIAEFGIPRSQIHVFGSLKWHEQNEFVKKIAELARDSEFIIAEHPYTYKLIKAACPDIPKWYRAHNVEYDYWDSNWRQFLPDADSMLSIIYSVEKECCDDCERIFTLTQADSGRLCDLYGISSNKVINISAGYDITRNYFSLPSERINKQNSYTGNSAVFISSSQHASIASARLIIKIAPLVPEMQFLIAGGVCDNINSDVLPENVKLFGIVSDERKDSLLKSANLALNLVESGGGMNIKMLEYFTYGIPVITTEFGARGIAVTDGVECIIADPNECVTGIKRFLAMSIDEKDNMARCAFELINRDFNWRNSAYKVAREIYGDNLPSEAVDTELHEHPDRFSFPNKPIYIRGAGKYGLICLEYMRYRGVTPSGFIDIDDTKAGTALNGIPVFHDTELELSGGEASVIVASAAYHEIISSLLASGMTPDNIIVAFDGYRLFMLDGSDGSFPYYFDYTKFCERYL